MPHDDLLPRPTCISCCEIMQPVAGHWWCNDCEEFAA